jgi:AbrB family looped-hinge helix DNA binding protein
MEEVGKVMRKIVKQLRHGQVTIPKEFREALGLTDEDMLAITLSEGKLEVEPVRVAPKAKGSPWARELYQLFAPVRESLKGYSQKEIDEAIDEAVREARGEKG